MGIAHWDEVAKRPRALGHLQGTWTFLGEAAGCVGVGVRRIEVPAGGWSTPAHEHGREEEIFFVLAGRGLSWQDEEAFEIGAGDCIVYRAAEVAHTLHALEDLDVLAFGPAPRTRRRASRARGSRVSDTAWSRARPASTTASRRSSTPRPRRGRRRSPSRAPRPATIVNLADTEASTETRGGFAASWHDLGRAAGSVTTGLKHVRVPPGKLARPQHCHSAEEEIFVILEGDGILWLGDEEIPVQPGHVVSRPPGTRVAHAFRGGEAGLTYLAYGTREPNDIVWYPRSRKIFWRGVGVIARVEPLDYWDGED